ncbi:MAG TPA: DUF427 domain-containing protein [Marmoricola sp.]|nr:DUF427 domain-containing protein [Marmoricola sp.]
MRTKPVLVPGPRHPISVEPAPGRVRVSFAGRVIADTDKALVLSEAEYPPVFYLPLDAVDTEVLEPSTRQTYCPYKGEAGYFTLRAGDRIADDAVWRYESPYDAVAAIAGHVAFYPQHVEIEQLSA